MLSQRAIEKRVGDGLQNDERWKVIVRGNNWLCPYCLRIGARHLRMDEPIEEKIALHFARECQAWDYFNADAHDMNRLRQMARYLVFMGRVVRWVVGDRRFRFFSEEAGWICPYCVTTLQLPVPNHPLDDAAAWGPAPEESPFAQEVARHLLACDSFAVGEEHMASVQTLEEQRARGVRQSRLEDLRARFKQEKSFQLMDQERRWLCPFCGNPQEVRLASGGRPDDAFFQNMEAHITICKAHRILSGRPRPVEELKAKVMAGARARQVSKIRGKVKRHSLWRVRDLDGLWYCPYCTTQTLVSYPERGLDGEVDPTRFDAFLGAILGHLSGCEEYRRPKARVASRAVMAEVIQSANLRIDGHRRIRRLLQSDPLFGVTDTFSNWLCPYCRKIQKQIVISNESESALFEKTIEQVQAHQAECDAWDFEGPPRATREELETVAKRSALLSSGVRERGVARATESLDEASWQRIKDDLEAVKSRVERARAQENSLREARSKQLRLLPSLPDLPGYEFGRVYKPCDAVGGDFYHLFKPSETTLGVAIGDISGHGIEAALLMGLAKKLIEVHGRGRSSPAQTLCLANRDIFSDLDERTFVTVFYGVLDVESRRFKFSRAGHDPLILFNERRDPPLQVLDSKGMALGMDEGPMFERMIEELEVSLEAGDLLLQYTDGVTEAMNSESEQFGLERLYAVVEEFGRHEVEYLLWKIERAVEAFRDGHPRSDDFTMIGFKVLA